MSRRAPSRTSAYATRARAAGAQQHHVLDRGAGQPALEPGRKPDQSVLWPTARPPSNVDGVDRAQGGGVGRERVEVLDHRLLARVGDVQAGEAQSLGVRHQLADLLGAEAEPVEVDQLVQVAQAELVGLPFVQRRAQRRTQVRPDETHDEAPTRLRPPDLHLLYELVRSLIGRPERMSRGVRSCLDTGAPAVARRAR